MGIIILTYTTQDILRTQFDQSPFAQELLSNTKRQSPTKLVVFDFDSTLFLSPGLSPSIWNQLFITNLTSENLLGPGWWRDIRSLKVGDEEELKRTAWEGFWNENIVSNARKAISDPLTMTVVLTGRRFHPFNKVVLPMLESKGLQFDLVGLRPDPIRPDTGAIVDPLRGELVFNCQPSIFTSTMSFKLAFLRNIFSRVPSLCSITMFDDRIGHVKKFSAFVKQLKDERIIKNGNVVYIKGIRPKYNPEWEHNVVQSILDSYNKICREKGLERMKVSLTDVPSGIIIKLTKSTTESLLSSYNDIYQNAISSRRQKHHVWGEQPEYFGNMVILNTRLPASNYTPFGGIGSNVDITVIAYSKPSIEQGMILKVNLKQANEDYYPSHTYILPLWNKPSEQQNLIRAKYNWINLEGPLYLKGKVDYMYLLGLGFNKALKRKAPF
ncbi:hypothetical protein J3Q64DRAFT_1770964 [Phycomyces blakesleeanus]|uniref:Swiss Army Knife RNA repair protein HAD domain-containing protein n=1 Tax=Phycomyces blakesleeanus TaxID=4837 RepID=A0ABR3AMD6_PHYBL